jgi:tetratricopeptide (TPR) repeat protein
MIRKPLVAALAVVVFVCPFLAAPPARGADTPPPSHYNILSWMNEGDYLDALRAYQSELRGAIKTAQSRWIDSICYETMCGECYYQMGVLDRSLMHYTNALQLYQQFPDWMLKVSFNTPTIRPASVGAIKQVPWGVPTRQSRVGHYPDSEKVLQTTIDANQTIKRGTMVQQGYYFPIGVKEIIRCTTLALRRRAELLGPVGKFDALSNDVIASMSRSIGPPNHWSNAWTDLERGLSLVAGGRDGQAMPYLQRSVLAAGEFDHPMTCVALLEMGRLALKRGEYPIAAKLFYDATFPAVNFGDYGVLEEALRYGAITHLASNGKGLYPPLEPAIQWAKVKGLRQLRASLLLCAAENYAVLGQTKQAAAMLDEARMTIAHKKMAAGSIGARLNYLSALVAFQERHVAEGDKSLAAAMNYMEHGSLWLFQIGMADTLYVNGGATPRSALNLFGEVLRDPLPTDWTQNPMESLSVLMTPQPAAMEHWFEVAMERRDVKEVQTAIEVAERTRRRRFFNSLEYGGRLESLRWILEAPTARLPQPVLLQRQDMLTRYPNYAELSQKAQSIRDALNKLPLVSEDAAAVKEQSRRLSDLATIGARQDAILHEIVLRREPAALVFPPFRTVPEIQKSLPDKHAILAFFVSGRNLYGFLMTNERCGSWRVAAPSSLLRQMQTMLRDMGQFGKDHEVSAKDLADAKWKQSARQVLDTLLKGSPADFSQPFDELAIVPDGLLWYLPFDALQVMVDKKSESLISRFRIRYAPTISLCTSQGGGRSTGGNTAVVVGKLFPRADTAVAEAAFEKLSGAITGAVSLRPVSPAPSSIYGTLFQRLIVLDDFSSLEQDPYGWALVPTDRGKPGSSLSDWLALPWGAPDLVVLPGFHTATEDGLKKLRHGMPGNEIFLSVCGLMANGSRTLLLSRWRTGGQTSFDLVREFVQELPRSTPSDAWQRAVLLAMDSRVTFESEPRVKHLPADDAPKATNPFFWAGYMLVDSGSELEKETPQPGGPILKEKPPKAEVKEKPKEEAKEEPKEEIKEPKGKAKPKREVKAKPKAAAKTKPKPDTEEDKAADDEKDKPKE